MLARSGQNYAQIGIRKNTNTVSKLIIFNTQSNEINRQIYEMQFPVDQTHEKQQMQVNCEQISTVYNTNLSAFNCDTVI